MWLVTGGGVKKNAGRFPAHPLSVCRAERRGAGSEGLEAGATTSALAQLPTRPGAQGSH